VDLRVTPAPVSEAVATTAYYVVAEALANALKHAEPQKMTIDVALEQETALARPGQHDDSRHEDSSTRCRMESRPPGGR